MILAFPNADENMIERFLSKTSNALEEAQLMLPDREKFINHLDEKVKKYGLHCLHDPSNLNSISKIEFSESIFQESRISTKISDPLSPPTEIINQMQTEKPVVLPQEPQITLTSNPAPMTTENFDFFEFDKPQVTPTPSPQPQSNQIIISSGMPTVVPQSSNHSPSSLKASSSKPIRIRFARYALGLFSVLMFLFLLKMFSELGSNNVVLSSNHVRFSSSHHRHHRA